MAGVAVDLTELHEQVAKMDEQLGELLAQVEKTYGQQFGEEPEDGGYQADGDGEAEKGLHSADQDRIEELFNQAQKNRSKAFELKRELDRLKVFEEYEDRFLDLFKKPGE